jgi:hypothetical protein
MKLTGLKHLLEQSGGGFGGSPGSGGHGGSVPVVPRNAFKFSNTKGIVDLASKLATGSGEVVKYAGAALATPPSQLAAGLSGRGSGLGWSKETAQQRFKWFRKGLPGALTGLAAGLAAQGVGNLAGKLSGSSVVQKLAGSKVGQALGNINKFLSPATGAIATTVAPFLKNYVNAGADELAKIAAAATGDFRDASVLGTTETEIKKPQVQQVKIVP